MSKEYTKISFTGDIMCESVQIAEHQMKDGKYDFLNIFSDVKRYFDNSDYVVSNLETPIAGKKLGYGNKRYSFNTPEEYLESIKYMGVNLVSTANNHCLDRGVEGLKNTIHALDRYGIKHIGTYIDKNKGFIEEINGIKVGFLSYTYGTNAFANGNYLKKEEKHMVNLFQNQELGNRFVRACYQNPYKFYSRLYRGIGRIFYPEQLKRQVYERKENCKTYLKLMKKEINLLKRNGAEYIIMCAHMGGQYNLAPSDQTKKLVDKIISYGVDAVIGNHEHVIHNCDLSNIKDGIIKTYSLGNFSGLAGVLKEPYDKLSEYSIIFNIYISKENGTVKVEKVSFAIAKSVKNGENKIKTVLLYDLIQEARDEEKEKLLADNLRIYNLFLNKNEKNIKVEKEYYINN